MWGNKGKENADLVSNFYPRINEQSKQQTFDTKNTGFDQNNIQISPVKKNKIGDSLITNIFDEYAKSSQVCFSDDKISVQHLPYSTKNIPIRDPQEDPESANQWKRRFQELHKNYTLLQRKHENRNRELFRLQETVQSQNQTIKHLEQQNSQLCSRYNGLLSQSQSQRSNRWGNTSEYQEGSGQVNRFYVDELERSIDNLQKQNKRLSDIVMRKMKNSFAY